MLKITPDPPQDGTFVSAPINDLYRTVRLSGAP